MISKSLNFQGGEFVFVDASDKLNRTIEPKLGRLSFFTSGIENKHHVKPITEGVRYVLNIFLALDFSTRIFLPRFFYLEVFNPYFSNRKFNPIFQPGFFYPDFRYALTMGFTCDKSKAIPEIGSEEHRQIIMK